MRIRIFGILLLLALFCNRGYATELMAEEAINYYNQGVKEQRMRNYYQAQTNYQKAQNARN